MYDCNLIASDSDSMINGILSFLILSLSVVAHAEMVVIEGAVPSEAIKQVILTKMYLTYGQENIVDKIPSYSDGRNHDREWSCMFNTITCQNR
jgi:hypothetical protein